MHWSGKYQSYSAEPMLVWNGMEWAGAGASEDDHEGEAGCCRRGHEGQSHLGDDASEDELPWEPWEEVGCLWP